MENETTKTKKKLATKLSIHRGCFSVKEFLLNLP